VGWAAARQARENPPGTPPESSRAASDPDPAASKAEVLCDLRFASLSPRLASNQARYQAAMGDARSSGAAGTSSTAVTTWELRTCDRTAQNSSVLSPKPVHVAIKQ
jgi:hypothetical protein